MSFFDKLMHLLQFNAPIPKIYGSFHILFLVAICSITIFICIKFRHSNTKTYKRILLICWIIMFVFEIYKQLVSSIHYEGNTAYFDYPWYIFPFQFCSTPLYIIPLYLILSKKEKYGDFLESFLGCFSLFGGLSILAYPGDCFCTNLLGIQIQTLVHHGLMVIVGMYILAYNHRKINFNYYLKGLLTFIILFFIAIGLNEVAHLLITDEFNMFYISRHFRVGTPISHVPVIGDFYNMLSYWQFLLIYALGVAIIGLITASLTKLFSSRKN